MYSRPCNCGWSRACISVSIDLGVSWLHSSRSLPTGFPGQWPALRSVPAGLELGVGSRRSAGVLAGWGPALACVRACALSRLSPDAGRVWYGCHLSAPRWIPCAGLARSWCALGDAGGGMHAPRRRHGRGAAWQPRAGPSAPASLGRAASVEAPEVSKFIGPRAGCSRFAESSARRPLFNPGLWSLGRSSGMACEQVRSSSRKR